jgi:hypothetical protein
MASSGGCKAMLKHQISVDVQTAEADRIASLIAAGISSSCRGPARRGELQLSLRHKASSRELAI